MKQEQWKPHHGLVKTRGNVLLALQDFGQAKLSLKYECLFVMIQLRISNYTLYLQAKRLYSCMLWFGLGRVQRIGNGIQKVIEGDKAKDTFLLCCIVMCSLVVLCVMSSLVILFSLKLVRGDKYIFPWQIYFCVCLFHKKLRLKSYPGF